MLNRLVLENPLVKHLLDKSSFTNTQLDTYLSHISIPLNDRSLHKRISMRDGKRVTKGAYLRSLKQGKLVLERAMYTLFLSEHLGLVTSEDADHIVRISRTLSSFREIELTPQRNASIIEIMKELERVISRS